MLTVQDCARESNLAETSIRSAMERGRLNYVEKYGRKLIERAEWDRYRAETKRGRPLKQQESP